MQKSDLNIFIVNSPNVNRFPIILEERISILGANQEEVHLHFFPHSYNKRASL